MYSVRQTTEFERWLINLRDRRAAARVAMAVTKLKRGLITDWKSVGEKIYEIRLNYGPGYRIYFSFSNTEIILLLCGGTKSSQRRDIINARKLREDYCE